MLTQQFTKLFFLSHPVINVGLIVYLSSSSNHPSIIHVLDDGQNTSFFNASFLAENSVWIPVFIFLLLLLSLLITPVSINQNKVSKTDDMSLENVSRSQ